MFNKIKAGIMSMAKGMMKEKREERESIYELAKTITKDVVNGLNHDSNKNLRKVGITVIAAGVVMIPIGVSMVINSYIR